MIKKNIATEHPWYRVLVDNSNHITYVKETLLEDDSQDDVPICHPDLHNYLEIRNGKYILHQSIN
jgi:heat shock protein HspQ